MLFISNLYSSLLVTKLFGEARRLKIGKPKKQNQVLQCLKKKKKNPILNVTFLDIKGSNFI